MEPIPAPANAAPPPGTAPSLRLARRGIALAVVAPRDDGASRRAASRALTTVLCTDIVDSTGHAVSLGDERWLDLLERYEAMVRAEVRGAGGRTVVAVGDGIVAVFPGAATAVRCALRVARLTRALGLEVRCGLHCGESLRRGPRLGGLVFHVATRVLQQAEPGEVLVSETTAQLAAGSTLDFSCRGRRTLRGLPGRWSVYRVLSEGGEAPDAGRRGRSGWQGAPASC